MTRYRRARWSFVKQNCKRSARRLRRSPRRACWTCSTPSAYSHAQTEIAARQASSEAYYQWVGGSSAFHRRKTSLASHNHLDVFQIAQCAKAIRCSTGVLRGSKGPRPIAPRARRMLRPNSLVLGSRGDDRSVETGNRNRHRLRDSGVTTPRRSSHRCKADEHKEYRRPRNV